MIRVVRSVTARPITETTAGRVGEREHIIPASAHTPPVAERFLRLKTKSCETRFRSYLAERAGSNNDFKL